VNIAILKLRKGPFVFCDDLVEVESNSILTGTNDQIPSECLNLASGIEEQSLSCRSEPLSAAHLDFSLEWRVVNRNQVEKVDISLMPGSERGKQDVSVLWVELWREKPILVVLGWNPFRRDSQAELHPDRLFDITGRSRAEESSRDRTVGDRLECGKGGYMVDLQRCEGGLRGLIHCVRWRTVRCEWKAVRMSRLDGDVKEGVKMGGLDPGTHAAASLSICA
jgi:hypothetical protein